MRPLGSFNTDELTTIDNGESETPKFVQEAIKRLEQNITANKYSEHNYKEMILKCTHLSTSQQDELLTLFASYSSLFDGKLGKIPYSKVHVDLKPNSKPFCARAYKIPHHIFDIARKEVEELCCMGVLQANIHSE
jgi:hypothetical protein